jgi:2-iminobutanoate/2-iminopropanoate deaminase
VSKPVGPYSPSVRAGDWLICSGQVGLRDGAIVEGGVEAETRQALANVRALVEEAGASLGHVAKTLVFITDMGDFTAMNDVYADAFGDHRPARSTIGVAALPMGARVEVEAWAWLGG